MSNNIVPESNKIGDKVIDRIYGDIHGGLKLILKNGTIYQNKIDKRSIKLSDGTMSHVFNVKNKWFDRTGIPIDKPDNLITRDKGE